MIENARTGFAALVIGAVLTGCVPAGGGDSGRARLPGGPAEERFLVLPTPPLVEADAPYDLGVAHRILSTLSPEELARRTGARTVGVNSIAWLSGSRAGREFMASGRQRVLVRGRPAASCPVAFSRTAPAGTSAADLAVPALTECLEQAPHPDCGCQVVAIGSVLMVPLEEMAYATGMTARVRAPALGLDAILVAEEGEDGSILLRDLNGPVGALTREADGTAHLRLLGTGKIYDGKARPVGYRRGRIAERIYLTGPEGARVSLLIGFDPDELAQHAGGWLAWPKDAG